MMRAMAQEVVVISLGHQACETSSLTANQGSCYGRTVQPTPTPKDTNPLDCDLRNAWRHVWLLRDLEDEVTRTILVLWNSVYPEFFQTDTPAAASTNRSPRTSRILDFL